MFIVLTDNGWMDMFIPGLEKLGFLQSVPLTDKRHAERHLHPFLVSRLPVQTPGALALGKLLQDSLQDLLCWGKLLLCCGG